MGRDFRSEIEFFFAEEVTSDEFILSDEEALHASRVMRKKTGDEIYATDGKGNVYKGIIVSLNKKRLSAKITERRSENVTFPNVIFYVPLLRNKERLRFAFEKLIELGFTRINFYSSERTIPKDFNYEKWRKVSIAAVKQSLRAYLPEFNYIPRLSGFVKTEKMKTVLLAQNGKLSVADFISGFIPDESYAVFIGPEGDFTRQEIDVISPDYSVKLSDFRLRSETAIISFAASVAVCK